jgi:hypothetical protein
MHRAISIYGRKIFSVALVFNALLTITCAVGILYGFYTAYPQWTPYTPYLLDGNLFWLIIAAAVINIFPAAHIGKVHTGRLWFHHYVWGLGVLILSVLWLFFGTSVSLLTVFFVNNTAVEVNVGRFFFLGGLALLLDDLPDVHSLTDRGVQWLKARAHSLRKVLHGVQLMFGFLTLYLFAAVALYLAANPQWITPANTILIGTLIATALTCFTSVKRKTWFTLQDEKTER